MEICYCALFEPRLRIDILEERVYTKNGDSLELDWVDPLTMSDNHKPLAQTQKIAIILGPVNGANKCNYTSNIMQELAHKGFRVVLAHYKNFKFYGSHHEHIPKVSDHNT